MFRAQWEEIIRKYCVTCKGKGHESGEHYTQRRNNHWQHSDDDERYIVRQMKKELSHNQLHIGFIQMTLISEITSMIMGQLKSLIMTAVKDQTGKFLKEQFRKRATDVIKE